jgi:hypothetical protein
MKWLASQSGEERLETCTAGVESAADRWGAASTEGNRFAQGFFEQSYIDDNAR